MQDENGDDSCFDDLDNFRGDFDNRGEVVWDSVSQLWTEAKARIVVPSWLVESTKCIIKINKKFGHESTLPCCAETPYTESEFSCNAKR
jgi:hypothetical protein